LDILLKESLVNSLVYNDQCNFRLIESSRELLLDHFTQDVNFLLDNLITHGITNTVTEDNDVLDSTFVSTEVSFTSIHVALTHIIPVNNLLALLLIVDL